MQRILVPLDNSQATPRVIEVAVEMAGAMKCRVCYSRRQYTADQSTGMMCDMMLWARR